MNSRHKAAEWPTGNANEPSRLAQLRETAARQREMAAEYHYFARESRHVADRIVYEEIARRALEHAQTCDRRADELAR